MHAAAVFLCSFSLSSGLRCKKIWGIPPNLSKPLCHCFEEYGGGPLLFAAGLIARSQRRHIVRAGAAEGQGNGSLGQIMWLDE